MDATGNAEKATALQRYGFLQLQQEFLLQRRSLSAADGSATPTPLCRSLSLSSKSPSEATRSLSISCSDLEMLSQSLDASLPPGDTLSDHVQDLADEEELMQINMDIKATLTSLLNNVSVRSNITFRTLIQSRLLHVEQELKEARKRRSSERQARRKSTSTLSSSSSASLSREGSFDSADDNWADSFNENIWRL